MNEVLKAISDRRSIRSYTDTQVTDEQLKLLIDAAVQSPSAVNRQPYHFTFVRNQEILAEFRTEAAALIRTKHSDFPADFDIFRSAPMVCFIFCAAEGIWPPVDSGIAVENIALAAHSIGLGSVILGMPMDVFAADGDKWYQVLQAPEGMRFAVAIGIGNPAGGKDAHPVRDGLVSVL